MKTNTKGQGTKIPQGIPQGYLKNFWQVLKNFEFPRNVCKVQGWLNPGPDSYIQVATHCSVSPSWLLLWHPSGLGLYRASVLQSLDGRLLQTDRSSSLCTYSPLSAPDTWPRFLSLAYFSDIVDCLHREPNTVEVCLHDVWPGDCIVLSRLVHAPCCRSPTALLTHSSSAPAWTSFWGAGVSPCFGPGWDADNGFWRHVDRDALSDPASHWSCQLSLTMLQGS